MPKVGDLVASKYCIEEILSSGGMGSVFAARHTQTKRSFALKVMLAELSGDDEAERRFMREARLAGAIDHPAVIKIYDVGRHGDFPYMVMELLEGESLGERLKRGPIPSREAVPIMLRAMEGVVAAHSAGIVHRDLKPDNIFLCRSPDGASVEPKVLDFGISKALEGSGQATQSLTKTGIALGTPLYMCAEQVRGARDVDERADVYSLGVILYQALTGVLPYSAKTYPDLVLQIITGGAPSVRSHDPGLSGAIDRVVSKAIATERQDRYPSVAAFADALRGFDAGVEPGVPRISRATTPETVTPFGVEKNVGAGSGDGEGKALHRRSTLWLGGAAAALVVGVVALGALAVSLGPSAPEDAEEPRAVAAPAPEVKPATELVLEPRPGSDKAVELDIRRLDPPPSAPSPPAASAVPVPTPVASPSAKPVVPAATQASPADSADTAAERAREERRARRRAEREARRLAEAQRAAIPTAAQPVKPPSEQSKTGTAPAASPVSAKPSNFQLAEEKLIDPFSD